MDWIRLAQDTLKLQAFVIPAINRVQPNLGTFLTTSIKIFTMVLLFLNYNFKRVVQNNCSADL